MKKTIILPILALFLLFSISFISACVDCPPIGITKITGTIYEGDITNVIPGADVTVTCNGHEKPFSVKSNNTGEYVVYFLQSQCTFGNDVTVYAEKGSLSGEEDGKITINKYKFGCFRFDVGIVDVPLIPEFGFFVGALTLMSALGVFFLVRRK